jgi:hypothetical protein
MARSHKARLFLWLLTLTTAGCATDGGIKAPAGDASTTTPSVERESTSNVDLVFKYRQQAAELRNEARRLEIEAEFYSQHQEDQYLAKRNLEMAREMRKAADVADDKARDYRAQVPHNQVN